jgi:hypothetical protein
MLTLKLTSDTSARNHWLARHDHAIRTLLKCFVNWWWVRCFISCRRCRQHGVCVFVLLRFFFCESDFESSFILHAYSSFVAWRVLLVLFYLHTFDLLDPPYEEELSQFTHYTLSTVLLYIEYWPITLSIIMKVIIEAKQLILSIVRI